MQKVMQDWLHTFGVPKQNGNLESHVQKYSEFQDHNKKVLSQSWHFRVQGPIQLYISQQSRPSIPQPSEIKIVLD